jgi:archaellum component FlaG (FlaF/FlaG flagellin family)
VQEELIAETHRTSLWPVVVSVDGNISKHSKTDFIDRDGSYIILIPDGKFNSFQVEINALAQEGKHKFTRLWNSETRFVVAAANEFTMLQQKLYLFISQNLEYITALS